MAKGKKKSSAKQGKGTAQKKSGAFVAFLRSQRFAHIRGAVYVLFSVFLVLAMVGYYVTDARGGWMGSLGHGVAEFFTTNLFGIGSLGFSLLFFVYGMRLWGVVVLPWWKTLGSTLFWMLWLSLLLGYIGGAWIKDAGFESYAGIGLSYAESLHNLMSWWTVVVLIVLAILFLVLVHKMQLPEVKMPKVDMKKMVRDVEKEIEKVATDHSDTDQAVETPESYDLKDDDDPGADFDAAAMELFPRPAVVDEETPLDLEPEIQKSDNEPAFSIDDEFARINEKAQGKAGVDRRRRNQLYHQRRPGNPG